MNCPRCQQENETGAEFYEECTAAPADLSAPTAAVESFPLLATMPMPRSFVRDDTLWHPGT